MENSEFALEMKVRKNSKLYFIGNCLQTSKFLVKFKPVYVSFGDSVATLHCYQNGYFKVTMFLFKKTKFYKNLIFSKGHRRIFMLLLFLDLGIPKEWFLIGIRNMLFLQVCRQIRLVWCVNKYFFLLLPYISVEQTSCSIFFRWVVELFYFKT